MTNEREGISGINTMAPVLQLWAALQPTGVLHHASMHAVGSDCLRCAKLQSLCSELQYHLLCEQRLSPATCHTGTVPVVRKTGGLNDTVFDIDDDVARAAAAGMEINGFNFEGADAGGVDYALNRCVAVRFWACDCLCVQVMAAYGCCCARPEGQ